MKLRYELDEAGWAYATIEDRREKIVMDVSYLHDSLKQLLEAIISLIGHKKECVVIFMSEPGEHHLILRAEGNSHSYELRWVDDCASLGMHQKDEFQQVISGNFELKSLSQCVLSEVDKIYNTYGIKGYKKIWVEHEFPYNQYMKLKGHVRA